MDKGSFSSILPNNEAEKMFKKVFPCKQAILESNFKPTLSHAQVSPFCHYVQFLAFCVQLTGWQPI